MTERKVITITEIDETEFSCKSKNLTNLLVKKDWLVKALEDNHIETILKHLATKIFKMDDCFLERQKVIALSNIIKNIKTIVKEEEYKLNLVLRNLNSYKDVEKSEKRLLAKNRVQVINTMITIAYNAPFNTMLKNMYKVA